MVGKLANSENNLEAAKPVPLHGHEMLYQAIQEEGPYGRQGTGCRSNQNAAKYGTAANYGVIRNPVFHTLSVPQLTATAKLDPYC
jgi:hypothetical protein